MSDVRVIRASELSEATAQTPGMRRAAAIDRASVGSENLWVGRVTVSPDAKTGPHHHGDCDSVVYITAGRVSIRWGQHLQERIEARPGDFIFIPARLVHQEVTEGDEDVDSIVIRSGDNVVVNVDLPEA